MSISVTGKGGIKATIIQDSISTQGNRIITYELEYPRFIHAELMTHRQFSRNAASSRAIPVDRMHKHIEDNPALPVYWGKNQAGMQAKEELEGNELLVATNLWHRAKERALAYAKELLDIGMHKQIANRVTEPFQMMKTIVTSTEWSNWDWLRFHADAQPEIHELAKVMIDMRQLSYPMKLVPGEWHLPYISRNYNLLNNMEYWDQSGEKLTLEDAKKVSASCCAQVSYRKLDDSLEKAKDIFNRLIHSEPMHASPIEHQATPMFNDRAIFSKNTAGWEPGVTHMNRAGFLGSGNLYGWIQYRQLIPNQSR